jgi:DNA-binding transcriptional MerR regulator
MGENMTISEVSKKYNLTQDTLRYYEKIGMLSNVPRNKSGIRNYDENSCRRIEFVKCMRDAGVEIEALLEYMELFEKGKSTAKRRKEILEQQREKLLEKQKNITVSLEKLDYKIELYNDIVSGKKKDFTETI